jgi:hypothetical protein
LAAAFGLVTTLGAQSSTTTAQSNTTNDRDSITVTGCLQRDANGSLILANAHIQPAAAAAGTYGSTTGTTGTTGTTATTESTWKLDGKATELDEHVGHKIEVTGKEKSPDSTSATSATTTTASGTTSSTMSGQRTKAADTVDMKKLDVKSVRMISSSCS